ncbi:acyl-CoA dehydrogenase NM domain-like protein [Choiromyces venosus 120613-1]|uniref:Acyl-CoA dehydrogenase NM domain-like protein n=1 Tax=Choiromyces venosus 120613-1 TaxID=1336337 RepID=A0A3N4KB88_9PEZI|nr:acyl-CoA dehydrogenase NM domain-like protein [Choiromyces venosus 120613-1]
MTTYQIPPLVASKISPSAQALLQKVHHFVETECIPADAIFDAQQPTDPAKRFLNSYPSIIDSLKTRAKAQGLWNLFLSQKHYPEGAPLTNLEYGLMAEIMGRSLVASEAMNCSAPDTGNMEVLAKYGSPAQKAQWLTPLLNGEIRSAFVMTERNRASADARNIDLEITRVGNEYVLNGTKWWSSGAGDPRCKLYLVMGKSDPGNASLYKQQSVVIVPAGTKGVSVRRALSVYGYDDAPHGHCEIEFKNVHVPLENMVLGPGRGFEIIQGRLGPGRIHHCMRAVGAAERALEYMIARVNDPSRKTFGKLLSEHGTILEWIARSRIEIDAGRLLVLNAADKIDNSDAKGAMSLIAQAKVYVPNMSLAVIDRAVQAHGAAGISQDFPLARMWAHQRTLRIADGPDEVHLNQLGRTENKKFKEIEDKIAMQTKKTQDLMQQFGIQDRAKL